jgi:hypothetical protein
MVQGKLDEPQSRIWKASISIYLSYAIIQVSRVILYQVNGMRTLGLLCYGRLRMEGSWKAAIECDVGWSHDRNASIRRNGALCGAHQLHTFLSHPSHSVALDPIFRFSAEKLTLNDGHYISMLIANFSLPWTVIGENDGKLVHGSRFWPRMNWTTSSLYACMPSMTWNIQEGLW